MDNNGQASRGNGKLTPEQEEIRRLKIENKQLKLERQILKEAAGLLRERNEVCQWRHYQTRYEAQQDILQYIAVFYNNQRLHSYLDYKSPNQYEAEAAKTMKVA